jgi:heterodisulfide reductase subunit C
MSQFGFSITASSTVNYDTADFALANFIDQNEPTSRLCISCGACSATCTGGEFSKLEMHKIHLYMKRNMVEKIRPELQNCMYCGKCQLVCPRGVNNRNIIRLLWEKLK